ncbi:TlpA family protein disulfide reductase, partial [Klebsiella pneumoniae]|nr:TlpA family protein disulfide reductase [Klebsiella pneumoniae]
MVDFWASHCGWCRAETPELLKVYNEYKDKGFTILGVSSDFKREDWLKAIDEDGAVWNHILMSD